MSQPEDHPASEPAPRGLPPPAAPPRGGWTYTYRWGQRRRSGRGCLWFPIALIAIGVIALLAQFGLLSWVRWAVVWPLLAIALGVALLLGRRR